MKLRIFTDGACSSNPGPGGWAAILNLEETIEVISGYEFKTTNNRMELMAVLQALKKAHKIGNGNIEIHSDSAYVINGIKNDWIVTWKLNGWKTTQKADVKNKDLWQQIDKWINIITDEDKVLNFIKVRGHAGNTFNEMADKEAVKECQKAKKLIEEEK